MGYGDLYLLWRDYGPFNEDVVRIYAAELGYALGLLLSLFIIIPFRDGMHLVLLQILFIQAV